MEELTLYQPKPMRVNRGGEANIQGGRQANQHGGGSTVLKYTENRSSNSTTNDNRIIIKRIHAAINVQDLKSFLNG